MQESPLQFAVEARAEGDSTHLTVTSGGTLRRYRIAGRDQQDYIDFFDRLAADFGTRPARNPPIAANADTECWTPLLTDNVDPRIRYGYGDPAVLRTGEGYYLTVTSNNAADAFPILRSDDLSEWEPRGFVFPEASHPQWTMAGSIGGDFWAPEMAKVGAEYWLCYTARDHDGALSIGLAKSGDPEGPWTDIGRPLIEGGMIDAHIFVEPGGEPWLLWKHDSNGRWPRPLARLLGERPKLIDELFDLPESRRSAAFAAAIEPWANTRPPIERFFLMQPLIRSVAATWPDVPRHLAELGICPEVVAAMTTEIFAQRLAPDGTALTGSATVILSNDQPWEAHLVEGPWVVFEQGRYWLFYAGNDFTSLDYGIGVAVADSLLGPYRKQPRPLLRSSGSWTAPGHASVARGPDGQHRLFFHAFVPGTGGYNAFRALLTARLSFHSDRVEIDRQPV